MTSSTACLKGIPFKSSHKPDLELIDKYQQNKIKFKQLFEMINQDKRYISSSLQELTDVDKIQGPLSAERARDYIKLLKELDLVSVRYKKLFKTPVSQTIVIEIVASYTSGEGVGYSYEALKGFQWREDKVGTITELDNTKERLVFRQIEGNFYLFFEHRSTFA